MFTNKSRETKLLTLEDIIHRKGVIIAKKLYIKWELELEVGIHCIISV